MSAGVCGFHFTIMTEPKLFCNLVNSAERPGEKGFRRRSSTFFKSLRLPLAFFKSPCKIRISSRQDASNRREKIKCAGVAQLVEQRIRNAKGGWSNPLTGTTYLLVKRKAKMPQSPRALRFFCCLKFFKAPAPSICLHGFAGEI